MTFRTRNRAPIVVPMTFSRCERVELVPETFRSRFGDFGATRALAVVFRTRNRARVVTSETDFGFLQMCGGSEVFRVREALFGELRSTVRGPVQHSRRSGAAIEHRGSTRRLLFVFLFAFAAPSRVCYRAERVSKR